MAAEEPPESATLRTDGCAGRAALSVHGLGPAQAVTPVGLLMGAGACVMCADTPAHSQHAQTYYVHIQYTHIAHTHTHLVAHICTHTACIHTTHIYYVHTHTACTHTTHTTHTCTFITCTHTPGSGR